MEGLTLAERRYQQVMPTPNLEWGEFPVRTLLVWLVDDVCPVLEDYSRRPAFRTQATWSLRTLVAGASTPERRCIETVDEALCTALRHSSRPAPSLPQARLLRPPGR